jgi:hypothetical protein
MNIKKKSLVPFLIIIPVVLVAIFILSKVLSRPSATTASSTTPKVDNSVSINRDFSFPINATEKDGPAIKFNIEKVEASDEIVVRGQKATAVDGRRFLTINLKITNDLNKTIQVNSRDYFRLSVQGKEGELLAPDIHNDPVEVQAISTKYTRIGFPVNDSDHDFILHVGEIKGTKEDVSFSL